MFNSADHSKNAGQSNAHFRKDVADVLLKMLGISHTANTKVGDALVRGISGGERKRVSIAEMVSAPISLSNLYVNRALKQMITGAAVASHDNSTRGLDASTALDYTKSIRM